MEKSEVDSIIRDILDTRKGSEKGRKKKTARFFNFISGGESPLEAVQLALGRNEKLQYAQYKALSEIVKFLENFNETKIGECIDSLPSLGRILFQCNLLKVLQRILQLRIPDETICKNIPWKMVYYYGLTVLKAVVDFSKKVDHFTKTLVETDTVELFMDFIDGKMDMMTCFPAVHGLASLCCNSNEARERVIFANGLSKLGDYIYKDNCQKMHVKAYKQGLEQYQIDELERLRETYVDPVHFAGTKYVGTHDASYHVLIRWSKKVQTASAQIILKIAEQNDRHRKLVFEEKIVSKALVKWIKTPAILQGELEMIDMSLRVISTLCYNHEISQKLVENYNIVKYLEYGVSIPDRDLYLGYMTVSLQLCAVGGVPREAISNSKKILQTLAMFVFSQDKEIHGAVLKTITRLVDSSAESATKVIQNGITPKTMVLLMRYYDDELGYCKALKQSLNRGSSRLWKKEEALLNKSPREFIHTLDADQAVRLKDIGNDKFKNDEYLEAIEFYSKALDVCPPAVKEKKEGCEQWTWWVTPAALYSNRAQAYLNTEDWLSAFLDCTQAIARCMEDDPKASNLLTKTAYRRAKALVGLGNYHEALNDVAVCMRNNYKNDDIRSLYRQILAKYRHFVGLEPIRRCAVCLEGEGDKLKRCANCSEVYCSRECQLYGWDNGHKQDCNNSKDI